MSAVKFGTEPRFCRRKRSDARLTVKMLFSRQETERPTEATLIGVRKHPVGLWPCRTAAPAGNREGILRDFVSRDPLVAGRRTCLRSHGLRSGENQDGHHPQDKNPAEAPAGGAQPVACHESPMSRGIVVLTQSIVERYLDGKS